MSQMIKENEFASDKNFDDITKFKDGGVKKKILRTGKGPRPTEFAECEIQYIGYFTSGKVWANTYRSYEKSETFQLKKKSVIYGWEIAVASMRKGEKARFKISSAYAYGGNGRAPDIPPDTNLVFDIELIDWKSMRNRKDKFMEKTNQSYEELLAGAEKEKEAGNEFVKSGEFHEAIERYSEAIQYARFVYEPKLRHTTRPLMKACELNKAFCYIKLKKWRDAIKACDEVLKSDMHEPKAYFRKAVAYRMMGQDAEAKKNILQAKRLEPEDPGIDREMTLIDWQWDQQRKKERRIFSSLFDEEKQKELEEKAAAAMAAELAAGGPGDMADEPSHPVRFKQDRERLQKTDHISLPGEDAALDKWGGAPSAELPRGDFSKFLKVDGEEDNESDKEQSASIAGNAKQNDDDNDDEEMAGMPVLEPMISNKRVTQPASNVSAPKKTTAAATAPAMTPAPASAAAKSTTASVASSAHSTKSSSLVKNESGDVDDDEAYVYDNSVTNESNPKVFFNFSVQGEPAGKVIVELFADRAPKTAGIFRRLCEKSYPGSTMTRFIPDYILQGADVGSAPFFNENMKIPIDQEGLLCVAAPGQSQFFFTLVDCSHLNGQYQVVGKVIEGIEVILEDMADIDVDENDMPTKEIRIRSAGDFDLEL